MQSQHYYLANPNQTQVIFSKILTQVIALYERFVPHEVRNRRNIHLQKQSDVVVIASYLWAIQEGCRMQVLFTVRFVIISSLTTSLNAHDFAVSVKILLKVFSVCAILWS
ncbi:Transposase [Streptococcus pneumoniae]|nr:Transposase [Streptococcus pneumoniae]VIZ72177.1 Transposase [Streptococcus pneumoniae]VKB49044.1 Transposase [Streptococcus pneumoniae]VKM78727.1 Transposase [Streptococcus pneumoniae]VNA89061.1 Transposase [Streptococcus pneumoniae]